MRSREVILRQNADAVEALESALTPPYALTAPLDLLGPSPRPRKPPSSKRRRYPRLHQKAPDAAWSPHVLRVRQQRIGWTPEEQLSLRDHQGNRCGICRAENPTCFDVSHERTPELHRISFFGFLCRRCKGTVDLVGHDPKRLLAALAYLNNPPARQI
jgi:hypothetical protein